MYGCQHQRAIKKQKKLLFLSLFGNFSRRGGCGKRAQGGNADHYGLNVYIVINANWELTTWQKQQKNDWQLSFLYSNLMHHIMATTLFLFMGVHNNKGPNSAGASEKKQKNNKKWKNSTNPLLNPFSRAAFLSLCFSPHAPDLPF